MSDHSCTWHGTIDRVPDWPWEVGAMFFYPGWARALLSPHYLNNVAQHRPPIVVMLPSRTQRDSPTPWSIDSHPTKDAAAGWSIQIDGELVVGERPDITVSPSIDAENTYHGFLNRGFLSIDHGVISDA